MSNSEKPNARGKSSPYHKQPDGWSVRWWIAKCLHLQQWCWIKWKTKGNQ